MVREDLTFGGITKNYNSNTSGEYPALLILEDEEDKRHYFLISKEQIVWMASVTHTQLLALVKDLM